MEGVILIESKEQVIRHYQHSIEKAIEWKLITNKEWRTPIARGKWTIAEVIGHLAPWDEFVRLKRIPYFLNGDPLPKSLDAEQTNRESPLISQRRSQQDIIEGFINSRRKLLAAIRQMEDEQWEREFAFNQKMLTPAAYFQGLLEHDMHHFRQIDSIRNEES